MVYPGQEIYFDEKNIENNCLDLEKQYKDLWSKAILKPDAEFYLQQTMPDVFFKNSNCPQNCTKYFGASTPLYIDGKVVGVYGAMLNANAFN